MRWSPVDPATHALAQSLLYQALYGVAPVPPRTEEPQRGSRRVGRPLVWDKATIIAALQGFFTQHGRTPTASEWQQPATYGIPGYATVKAEFGSVVAGLRAAGIALPLRRRPHRKRNHTRG